MPKVVKCPSHKDAKQEPSSGHHRGGDLQGSPIKNVFACKQSGFSY